MPVNALIPHLPSSPDMNRLYAGSQGRDQNYRELLAQLLSLAPHQRDSNGAAKIEEILRAAGLSDFGGTDEGGEAISSVAKAYGARPPWHRDFNGPPSDYGDVTSDGISRPLRRSR